MAGAMLEGWRLTDLDLGDVTVIRPSGREVGPGIRVLTSVPKGGPPPTIVLLGVKPQKLPEVVPILAPVLGPETILISILAGIELDVLRHSFPGVRAIVRALPNLPARIGHGMTALCTENASAEDRQCVEALMMGLGNVIWLREDAMHAATALIGSAPAFVFRFIEAFESAGRALGLSDHEAHRITMDIVASASEMAYASNDNLATLAGQVASPGGTTEAGLKVLDKDSALKKLIARTFQAARERSVELAAAARPLD